MRSVDVLVVGGGVVGCSIAYHAAAAGLSVTLLERDELGAHASGAAAGMLAPISESEGEGPFLTLALESLGRFSELVPRLLREGGTDGRLIWSGVFRTAHSEAEALTLRRHAEALTRHGVQWLDEPEVRLRVPLLAENCRGALWSPREGHVSSPILTRAYAQAAAALGARVRQGETVRGLQRDGERVVGVHTDVETHTAATVVLATGAWTRFCEAWVDVPLPVSPVRGQIVVVEAPSACPREILWGSDVYLVPKLDGTLIVGATMEDAGFDARVTANAVRSLLAAAAAMVPAVDRCTFLQAWAGLRPDTPDHLPLMGPIPGISGLLIAAGHYRNGVLLSPVTGELITRCILDGRPPDSLTPFSPARFS